jgi:nucleotide-binding universal stress UspA family protein
MAKRILVPLVSNVTADYSRAAVSAARIARKTGGLIRLACLMPLPPPRVDDQDRVVSDTEREMERLAAQAETRLRAMIAEMEGVPVEMVIRFGRPRVELLREVEVFEPDLVALPTPLASGAGSRLRAWLLRRAAIASRVPVALLPLPMAGAGAPSRGTMVAPALR